MGNTVGGLLKEDEETKERLRRHIERQQLRKEGKLPPSKPREKGGERGDSRPSGQTAGEKKRGVDGSKGIDSVRSLRRGEKENSMADNNNYDSSFYEDDYDDRYEDWVDPDRGFNNRNSFKEERWQPPSGREDRYRDRDDFPREPPARNNFRGRGGNGGRGGGPPMRGGGGPGGRLGQPGPSGPAPRPIYPQQPNQQMMRGRGGAGAPAGRGMMRPGGPFPPGMRGQGPPMHPQQQYPPPMTLRDAAAQKRIQALEEQVRRLQMQKGREEDDDYEPEIYSSYDRKMLQVSSQARSRGRVATVIRGGHAAATDLRNMGNPGRLIDLPIKQDPVEYSDVNADDTADFPDKYDSYDRKYDSYERQARQSGSHNDNFRSGPQSQTRIREDMRNSGGASYDVQEVAGTRTLSIVSCLTFFVFRTRRRGLGDDRDSGSSWSDSNQGWARCHVCLTSHLWSERTIRVWDE